MGGFVEVDTKGGYFLVKLSEVGMDEIGGFALEEGGEGIEVGGEELSEGRVLGEEEEGIRILGNELKEEGVLEVGQNQILKRFREKDRIVIEVVIVVGVEELLEGRARLDCLHILRSPNLRNISFVVRILVDLQGGKDVCVSGGDSIGMDGGVEVGIRVSEGGESKNLIEGKVIVGGDGGGGARDTGGDAELEIDTKGFVLKEEVDEVGVQGKKVHDLGVLIVGIRGGHFGVIVVLLKSVIEESNKICILHVFIVEVSVGGVIGG